MKLNKNIVKKYNILIQEVVTYYGIDSIIVLTIIPSLGLLCSYAFNWDSSIPDTISDNMIFLQKNYPYLEAFYKIFISMFSRKYKGVYINDDTFNEINKNIKKIREEKIAISK